MEFIHQLVLNPQMFSLGADASPAGVDARRERVTGHKPTPLA